MRLLFLGMMLVAYFFPALLAYSRKHPDRKLLLGLNALLGVTVVGWFLILGAVLTKGKG